ncbi:hypothetical protein NKI59_21840 [Mesorhizobium sp. M0598]|uniref:hypothetical protein n=1 Tax=Mesorhizobium sp. M0598 TaxID=2956968 RepID=UPI003336913D
MPRVDWYRLVRTLVLKVAIDVDNPADDERLLPMLSVTSLPSGLSAFHAMILAEHAARIAA